MELKSVILCIAAVFCIWMPKVADSQRPSVRCRFSRVDDFPCLPNARPPVANEQGIYRTRIGRGASGSLECFYRNQRRYPASYNPINDLGNPNLRLLFSPGFLLDDLYANAMLVTYNVQCPGDRLAFYNLIQLDLQDPDCFGRCTDYVEVNHPGFGVTESCGIEPGENRLQLGNGTFTVTFRTGERTRGRGFELYIICYEPLDLDLPGCVRIGENSTNTTRRKRDLDEFHNQWQRRLKRGAAGTRFQQLNIQFGERVTFRDSTLTVIRNGEVFASFRDVVVLHTYDSEGRLDRYIREAIVMNQTTGEMNFIEFVGPGPMTIIGRHAYFQLFAIDPRGVIPNPAEMAVFEELTTELFGVLSEENDTSVPDPEPPTEPFDLGNFPFPGLRRKRQGQPGDSTMISDAAIRDAICNENACNPALLTAAQITLEIANEQDSDRVQMIRDDTQLPCS